MTSRAVATATPAHVPLPQAPVDRVRPSGQRVPASLVDAPYGAPVTPAPVAPGGPVDIVDQWGEQSFPASDPPANW
ncbi:hypothetical protein [Plantactinospora sp. BC1]|uniref:hypothetical protein n=1 Tax=Plantactinospora sp. BC1 TaxID=2108470 RepID=UPI00131F0C63|nr:hypothetical protein [Plantactinospora sp. BC1]